MFSKQYLFRYCLDESSLNWLEAIKYNLKDQHKVVVMD